MYSTPTSLLDWEEVDQNLFVLQTFKNSNFSPIKEYFLSFFFFLIINKTIEVLNIPACPKQICSHSMEEYKRFS